MFWPFRRKAGKHQFGAAVTSIPAVSGYDGGSAIAGPVAPISELPPVVAPAPDVLAMAPAAVVVPASYEPPAAPEPRVELGFRDGSTAALAPGSDQARALTDLASLLTRRD